MLKRTSNCHQYLEDNGHIFALNNEIEQYEEIALTPSIQLAFSHMLHNQVAIYEAFLAMYFRPRNFYCIHVDAKAESVVRRAVEALVNCYAEKITTGSIFVIKKKESIEVRIS